VVRLRIPLLVAGGVLAAGVGLAMTVVALSPSATRRLSYQDIDAEYLDRTLVVVSASRSSNTPFDMKGATLFVDRASGDVERIDNDGLDNSALAFDGEQVGFADEAHDYRLGASEPVRKREKVSAPSYGSFWVGDTLVTAFNGGFGEEHYELGVSESGESTSFRYEAGYVEALTRCDDGVWMVRNPDFESVDRSASLVVDRLSPSGGRAWDIEADSGWLQFLNAACQGHRLVAVGTVSTGDDSTDVVADIDLVTGASNLVALKSVSSPGSSVESFDYSAAALGDDGLHVVSRPSDGSDEPFELLRIDPATGHAVHIAVIEDETDVEMKVRIQGDHLYVLDVTRDTDSRLRAFRLSDGKLMGTRLFEPLDPKLNSTFASFDTKLFVWDFAVTTPVERW